MTWTRRTPYVKYKVEVKSPGLLAKIEEDLRNFMEDHVFFGAPDVTTPDGVSKWSESVMTAKLARTRAIVRAGHNDPAIAKWVAGPENEELFRDTFQIF